MREIVFEVNVTGTQHDTLELTLGLLYDKRGPEYWAEKDGVLYLYDYGGSSSSIKFPVPMGKDMLYPMVKAWLAAHEPGKSEPNYSGGDGTTKKGFNIKHDGHRSMVEIKSTWVYYGK